MYKPIGMQVIPKCMYTIFRQTIKIYLKIENKKRGWDVIINRRSKLNNQLYV